MVENKIKEDYTMALRINTNVGALNAHRRLTGTELEMNKSMGKLSSGYRINTAGDDASGLVTANSLRAEVRGLKVSAQASLQTKANLSIAEGDGQTIENILERMYEVAVGGGTQSTAELNSLSGQITAITGAAGANASIAAFSLSGTASGTILTAIGTIGTTLGNIGAAMNAEDFSYQNILTKIENKSASESAIRDADMASEMVTFTKTQIMLQAGTAMLAQANSSSQSMLSLFR
jgi:flagellin